MLTKKRTDHIKKLESFLDKNKSDNNDSDGLGSPTLKPKIVDTSTDDLRTQQEEKKKEEINAFADIPTDNKNIDDAINELGSTLEKIQTLG